MRLLTPEHRQKFIEALNDDRNIGLQEYQGVLYSYDIATSKMMGASVSGLLLLTIGEAASSRYKLTLDHTSKVGWMTAHVHRKEGEPHFGESIEVRIDTGFYDNDDNVINRTLFTQRLPKVWDRIPLTEEMKAQLVALYSTYKLHKNALPLSLEQDDDGEELDSESTPEKLWTWYAEFIKFKKSFITLYELGYCTDFKTIAKVLEITKWSKWGME